MPNFFDFPILVREWRARFRRNGAFLLLAVLVGALTWAMMRRLNDGTPVHSGLTLRALAPLSQDLLVQLVWTQIAGVCLLAPMLSSPLIARERESGALGDLLLTPLSPLRLTLEKWAAGALFPLLVLVALWPLDLVALLLGDSPVAGMLPVALLCLGCLAWGSALGTACSAHARRAALAMRSATGIALVWGVGSLICAATAGEAPLLGSGLGGSPLYVAWFGRTNPILCALELLNPSPLLPAKWPFCAGFLLIGTALFLLMAARGLQKPLPELPILTLGSRTSGVSGALAHLELPLVGRFAPRNPVLGREARGKFRLRQPPLPVLVAEVVLALGVGALYLFLMRQSWIDPLARPTIFWGVAWTGFFVSILAASSQGGVALARERENGTWEALQLSLLSAREIVRGKLVASLALSLLLSLPAWPLLLFTLDWSGSWSAKPPLTQVQPWQFIAATLIWLGILWLQTLVGLLFSTRVKKSGGAIGLAVVAALGWMFGSLFLFLIGSSDESALGFLAVTNSLVALAVATDPPGNLLWASSGWPFALFAFAVGALLLVLIESEVESALRGERALE